MNPSQRLRELASVQLPWQMAKGSVVAQTTASGFNNPNAVPEPESSDQYLKLSHETNWYMNDVIKNIQLYGIGDIVYTTTEPIVPDDFESLYFTPEEDEDREMYVVYLRPYDAAEYAVDQINNLFGSSVMVDILSYEEFESETK